MSQRAVEVLRNAAAILRGRRERQRRFLSRVAFYYRIGRRTHRLSRSAALRRAWFFAR